MNKTMEVLATRFVEDAQVVFIKSATYKGSLPFSGVFQVSDVDYCRRFEASAKHTIVTVQCCWSDEPEHEDSELALEVADAVSQDCVGFSGEVVARIDFCASV